MKRIALVALTVALLFSVAAPAQAGNRRRSQHRSYHRASGISVQLGTLGYGYGALSTLPSYRYGSHYYGYDDRDRCYDHDYDRLMYYHQRSRAFAYPQHDYGFGGRGAFDGSPYGGNSWYWRSQQAGHGNVSWGQLYNEMYGGR